jgi:hypothetical protein
MNIVHNFTRGAATVEGRKRNSIEIRAVLITPPTTTTMHTETLGE